MAFCTSRHTYLKVCLGSLVSFSFNPLCRAVFCQNLQLQKLCLSRFHTGLLLSVQLVFVRVYNVCVFLELCAMLAEFFHCLFVLLPSNSAYTVLLQLFASFLLEGLIKGLFMVGILKTSQNLATPSLPFPLSNAANSFFCSHLFLEELQD